MRNLSKNLKLFGLATFTIALMSTIGVRSVNSTTESIPFSGKFFTTDNLGNVFLVQSDNSIEKYGADGNRVAVVNFKIYGSLSQLDVTNPFEIYCYYADQQVLLILDNLLNVRAEIDMTDVSTGEVSAAARSFDNGIWYFDASSMKLLKATKNLATQIEGVPMGTWTKDVWKPTQLLDNEKNIFVHDSANGICLFDVFGNYYKSIDIKGLLDFQVKKNKIIYFEKPHLVSYDYTFFESDTTYIDSLAKMVRTNNGKIYSWVSDSIQIISRE